MKNTLSEKLSYLKKQAKNSGASELNVLIDFFEDLSQDENGIEVFIASCDEFIAYAIAIKKVLNETTKIKE